MNSRVTMSVLLLATALILLPGAAAHGAVITPTSAEASMCYEWQLPSGPLSLINGIGLNQVGDVTTWTHNQSPGSDANQWLNNPDYQPTDETQLWFYLSGPTDLSKAYLWQYTSDPARGLNGFTIRGSTTAGKLGTFTDLSGPQSMAISPVGPSVTQTFNLSNATGIQTVRIDIASSHGDYYVGLAEVRLGSAPVSQPEIPEPATLALLGLGVAGLGGYIRRRFDSAHRQRLAA